MGIFRGGRLRRLALVMSLGVLTALSIAGATSARVDDGSSGSAPAVRLAEKPESVTFCHVAGRADDPANMVTLTLPYNAAFGQGGHFDENGTPQAGHENDYLGPCQTPPSRTDVCPNIDGNQATVPDGLVKDEQGNCVTPPPPPTDLCPNIDGNQATVPAGMVKDEQGKCVAPPTDVCPNIEGNQAEVPDGLVKDEQGNCVTPPPTGAKHLVVTKTAGTSWYKVYTWDVEKSVDRSQLNLSQGETGSVEWKVDVTQTGWTAQNMVVGGTITVGNPNGTAVTGVLLTDQLPDTTVFCGANDAADLTVPANGSITCIYAAPLQSTQGGTNAATAVGSLNGMDVSDTGTAIFTFSETPNYEIDKTVKAVDGENTWSDITGTTSFTYDEEFPCSSQGRTNVVDLLGDNPSTDQVETDSKLDTDSASVTVRCSESPPPPPPPSPPAVATDEFMDVQVVKDATPQVQLVNGLAEVAYTVRVRNNGPNQAHDVTVADAAPGGVTFVAVTQQPVNGSCSIGGGALLQCSLGTLGPGVERLVGVSARVSQTGTYVNCATGTGSGKDTNAANNRACASTLVTAPVTPPTPAPKPPVAKPQPKPKPKPVVNVCRVLKVTPGLVKANGKDQPVVARVTRSRTPVAGVAVRFTASGLDRVVRTNGQGVARVAVRPGKAGILIVRITSVKACNSARIGVVGVFEPPVTG